MRLPRPKAGLRISVFIIRQEYRTAFPTRRIFDLRNHVSSAPKYRSLKLRRFPLRPRARAHYSTSRLNVGEQQFPFDVPSVSLFFIRLPTFSPIFFLSFSFTPPRLLSFVMITLHRRVCASL